MRRGALTRTQQKRRADIAAALEAQELPAALAQRMAFQLVVKFDADELGDHGVWRATGQLLRHEMARLHHHLGLAERQIVCVLPKLSARQVEDLLDELRAADRRIARTIFDAAIEAAHPVATARRYLGEYRAVADELRRIDPTVARTLANACFTATAPRRKAIEHFKQFATLLKCFEHDTGFARKLARAAFRAPDPIKTAEQIIRSYARTVTELTDSGLDPQLARTLAGSSRFRQLFAKGETHST